MRRPGVQIGNSDSKMKWPSILPALVLAFLAACASPAPPTSKSVESDAAPTHTPLIIIQNSDGTFTVQKEPPKGEAENANAEKGLVIPPQVVVPLIPAPEKRN
jgi:hypothetical protein